MYAVLSIRWRLHSDGEHLTVPLLRSTGSGSTSARRVAATSAGMATGGGVRG